MTAVSQRVTTDLLCKDSLVTFLCQCDIFMTVIVIYCIAVHYALVIDCIYQHISPRNVGFYETGLGHFFFFFFQ